MANWGDFHNVTGAGWSAFWRISKADGSGLELWWADFKGKRVLWRGTQPLAIVPYHHPVAFPTKGDSTFKDGLNPQSDGASFLALKFQAPDSNLGHTSPWNAAKDTEAVFVEVEPASPFKPETLAISAKFQCGWYQYLHRWEFSSDGVIEPNIAMGGALNPYAPDASHVHHMLLPYRPGHRRIPKRSLRSLRASELSASVRGRLDHAGQPRQVPGGSQIEPKVPGARSRRALPRRARPVAMRSSTGTVGRCRQARHRRCVGDHLSRRQPPAGRGCRQRRSAALDAAVTAYATGPLNTVNGSDVVLWVVIRHHHEPRERAEEKVYLPYHYAHFSIVPRGFEIFREPPAGGHDG